MTVTFPRPLQEATGCPLLTKGALCAFPVELPAVQDVEGRGFKSNNTLAPCGSLALTEELPRAEREWLVGAGLKSPRGPSHRQHLAEVRFRMKSGNHS